MTTVKVKGHLKTKVKVTKNYENSFFAKFYGNIFYLWCQFGVMSQFKGQTSRSLEGHLNASVTFRLTTILSHF